MFPAPRGGIITRDAVSGSMKAMHADAVAAGGAGWLDPRSGAAATPHGLRSVFRDWAGERTEYPRDMAEMALAHKVGSEVEQAYRRGDALERRRAMMSSWARFLFGKTVPKVVALIGRG